MVETDWKGESEVLPQIIATRGSFTHSLTHSLAHSFFSISYTHHHYHADRWVSQRVVIASHLDNTATQTHREKQPKKGRQKNLTTRSGGHKGRERQGKEGEKLNPVKREK